MVGKDARCKSVEDVLHEAVSAQMQVAQAVVAVEPEPLPVEDEVDENLVFATEPHDSLSFEVHLVFSNKATL